MRASGERGKKRNASERACVAKRERWVYVIGTCVCMYIWEVRRVGCCKEAEEDCHEEALFGV